MNNWVTDYLAEQARVQAAIPVEQVTALTGLLDQARMNNRQIFVFGNGGSAANASHFATDLGKGASDVVGPFRILSLNDNTSWISALGNDYSYADVFLRQLQNYGQPGDVALAMSVSGNSPNVIRAMEWARDHGLVTIGLTGRKGGRLAETAAHVLAIDSDHFGIVEDAHMGICHLMAYAFMEKVARH